MGNYIKSHQASLKSSPEERLHELEAGACVRLLCLMSVEVPGQGKGSSRKPGPRDADAVPGEGRWGSLALSFVLWEAPRTSMMTCGRHCASTCCPRRQAAQLQLFGCDAVVR